MNGYLKKDVTSKWNIQPVQIKRYFELDFTAAVLTIRKTQNDSDILNDKQLVFGDIISVEVPEGPELTKLIYNAPEKYKFPFILKTKMRDWTLYVQWQNERQMWLDGFNYAIHSAKEAQRLIESNDKEIMNKTTEEMNQT